MVELENITKIDKVSIIVTTNAMVPVVRNIRVNIVVGLFSWDV